MKERMERFEGKKATGGWVRNFSFGWAGPEGVVSGLRAVEAGDFTSVTFVVADHPTAGALTHQVLTVGIGEIDGEKRWRYCGERNDPMGPGSSTVCHGPELVDAVAVVMSNLERTVGRLQSRKDATPVSSSASIYRQP